MSSTKKIDRIFLINAILLIAVGFFIFLSASLGLTARQNIKFSTIVLNQLILGLIMGGIFAFIVSRIKFTFWKKISFWMFIVSIFLTLLVFVPGLGLEHGGAKRWLSVGPLSFQPAEFLKITFILYIATWLSNIKTHVRDFKHGVLPLALISGIVGIILLAQPDTDTFIVMAISATSMFVVAGGRWKHIILIALIGLIGLAGLIATRPYIKERIFTFLNPASDSLTSSYQIQQSLIAIGSGGLNGRGFGQSIQKFSFLPEPIGDSIFAVAAEEFGFIGALILIMLFLSFALKGFKISAKINDPFGGLVMVGLVTLIITQSFMNIAAMLGVIPLSGLPLLFVSHGGTALFFTLVATGILFNISRYRVK